MSSITLHPTKGVNPKMVHCAQCGKKTNELLLMGNRDFYTTCPSCGMRLLGGGKCPKCNVHGVDRKNINSDTVTVGICEACDRLNQKVTEEVEAGGIFWRCIDCKSAGAIKAGNAFAASVRDHLTKEGTIPPHTKGEPYALCGIEFTKEPQGDFDLACPVCGCNDEA